MSYTQRKPPKMPLLGSKMRAPAEVARARARASGMRNVDNMRSRMKAKSRFMMQRSDERATQDINRRLKKK